MKKSKPVSLNALREALRLIRATRKLLGSERRWVKGMLAADRNGRPALPGGKRPKPVSWCLLGAALEVEHRRSGKPDLEGTAGLMTASAVPRRLRVALEALRIGCLFTIVASLGESADAEQEQGQPAQPADAEVADQKQPEDEVEQLSLVDVILASNDHDSTTYEDVLEALDFSERLLRETIAERLAKRTTSKPSKRGPASRKEREGR